MPPRRQRPKESPALIAFGGQMRRMREGKKITQQSIADHTNISKGQVSRIENGTRRATRSFVEAVDRILEADGALIKLWADLNRNGHPVPIWFDWPKVEADAATLISWEPMLIAGLVQTPAYASALLNHSQEAVEARLRRPGHHHRQRGTSSSEPGPAGGRAGAPSAGWYVRDDQGAA